MLEGNYLGKSYIPETIARITIPDSRELYTQFNPTLNPQNSEKRDCGVLGAVLLLLVGGLIGGAIVASYNHNLNQKAQRILNNKKPASRYNSNNSRELETELGDIGVSYIKEKVAELYNNGLPRGPAGHVPDMTGPHGIGMGEGKGEGKGAGWEAMLQWVQTPEGIIWLKTQEGQEWIGRTGAVLNYNKTEEYIKDYDAETKGGIENNEKPKRLGKTVEDKKGNKERDLENRVEGTERGSKTEAESEDYANKNIDGDYEPIETGAEVEETEAEVEETEADAESE